MNQWHLVCINIKSYICFDQGWLDFIIMRFFPGEYKQNLCKSNSTSCTPCPERLPTCVGFSNGLQPHPSNLWTTLYIICDRNRTIHIERCQEGQIFHPDLKQCVNPSAIGKVLLDVCFTHNFTIYIRIFHQNLKKFQNFSNMNNKWLSDFFSLDAYRSNQCCL